ncbi:MAG: hypothetical protein CMI53_03920 [Parcubacteria group bacterium]|nr:hypothetical protein [Parcubacteria group bacterium]|tara:strand:+ start:8747 stop:9982 length:1236 start_codon:yes stop_codon:yes gene_type:complete
MKLLEYKGKELLEKSGIKIPPAIVTNNKSYINLSYHKENYRQFFVDNKKIIIKPQVIGGNRKKLGLIGTSDDYATSLELIDQLYDKEYNNQPIDTLLIEKKLEIDKEYFLAIVYDTVKRQPMILFSKNGGINAEDEAPKDLTIFYPRKVDVLHDFEAREIARQVGFKGAEKIQLAGLIKKVFNCFIKYDCTACEINPIIKTKDDVLYAGDAKITIDDNAIARQEIFHDVTDTEEKSVLNQRELEARRIDIHDHRGVAGKTFVDLDGDIAVLASGGGASLTCMDALIQAGGAPANYTEYSGNPSAEKVKKLTEVTLSKEGLNGCLVIGGTANFTDIFETLSGFAEGLKVVKPKPNYPIVVRRAGPNDEKAFAMLKKLAAENDFDISLYGEETPMTLAAKLMAEKVKEHKLHK